ncbi:hypothetical protein COL26b_010268 [Colletotrichum chrysophilum]|uniref:uncharacterized protein n=1 Tax=Colletotrichum chrysophilum TaxID=1836956 RepID=UPI0023012EA8|nr:uncharacterized protein COL26b_010268 [Colletotrichum chrysophilum]KAJ0369745.1 hypothetical protein COL26b_010268 [Colletotrichum chrysophilum]
MSMNNPPTPYGHGMGAAPSPSPAMYGQQYTPQHASASPVALPHQTPVPLPQIPPHQASHSPQQPIRPMYQQQGYFQQQQQQQQHLPPQQHHQPPPPHYPQAQAPPVAQHGHGHHQMHPQMMTANSLGPTTFNHHQMQPHPTAARTPMASAPNAMPPNNAYNPPRPPEVFVLPDHINDQIPEEVRSQYNRDENGRIIFFTTPPAARPEHGLAPDHANTGHSLAYLAKSNPEWLSERASKAKAFSVVKQKELKTKMVIDEITKGKTQEELHDWASDAWALYWKSHAQETMRMREDGDLDGHDQMVREQHAVKVKSRREREEEADRAEEAKKASYLEGIYSAHTSMRSSKPRGV